MLNLSLLLAAASTGLVALAPAVAPGDVTDPAPSIAQVCAATGIEEVDALLDGVASSDLSGALAPLAALTVPDRDTVELDASVQLDDVRKRLNCAPTTPPTTDPTPAATVPIPVPDEPNPSGFTQLDRVPSGAAETGGGPA